MTRQSAHPKPPIMSIDFNQQPFVLAWELTRACNLACVHCRADAQLRRSPGELTFQEACRVIDEVTTFPIPPVLVLTGGDPMRRPDIADLVSYGSERGIRCTVTPAGTPAASRRRLADLKAAGVARIAISLDGPSPVEHDDFRQVAGSFSWTMDIVRHARELDIELQVHTTLCQRTLPLLAEMATLVDRIDPAVWAVFCLVPTGRAEASDELLPEEYERTFNWLLDRSRDSAWDLKLTEGYHFRRVQQERRAGRNAMTAGRPSPDSEIGRAPKAVNSGNGFCFISHIGEISPSGFLPIVAGNVRTDSLVDVYRNHAVFRDLRDPDRLKGPCGSCVYRTICGGSRSRAFAHAGDYLASDPACILAAT
jgi:AdoMet-dependent heme synthase